MSDKKGFAPKKMGPKADASRTSTTAKAAPKTDASRSSILQKTVPKADASRISTTQRSVAIADASRSSTAQRSVAIADASRVSAGQRSVAMADASRVSAGQRSVAMADASRISTTQRVGSMADASRISTVQRIGSMVDASRISTSQRMATTDVSHVSTILQPTDSGNIDHHDTLYDIKAVAPPPSRDFYQIQVLTRKIIVRHWVISHARRMSVPLEERYTYGEFENNMHVQESVVSVFGQGVLDRILKIINGEVNFLDRLPRSVLIRVMKKLSIPDREKLALTNTFLKTVADSDEVWETTFMDNFREHLSQEIVDEAMNIGWRETFYKFSLSMERRSIEESFKDLRNF